MNDPLLNYYRTKEVYVLLPTQGRWYKNKPNLTQDGEIGIYPMSVRDEIMLKIPDTLYNGEALFEVIQSVAPDIVDPYEIAIPDVEVILLAAKASQHGGELNISGRCPHCNTSTTYGIEITKILQKVKVLPDNPVTLQLSNGLIVEYKPNTLASINAGTIKTTESIKLAQAITDNTDPEQAKEIFKESLEKTTAATIVVLADSIASITTPDGDVVTDIQSISNWLANCDALTTSLLKKHSTTLNENGVPNDFDLACSNEECGETFKTQIEYNPAFFFTTDYEQSLT